MVFLLIFATFVFVSAIDIPIVPNKPRPDPTQAFHPPNNIKEPSVFSNSIDLSKAHNSDFLKQMNFDKSSKSLEEWLNSSPEARTLMNKVFMNYGVLAPEQSGYSNGLALPSPQYLLQTVEESLAIHESFKDFLRKLLENVQQYLIQCTLMIAETVIRLERKYEQLRSTIDNLNNSKSNILKTNYSKHLFDLKNDSETLIKRYESLKTWKLEVEGKIQKNL